jgi:hypothetical protein
MKSASTLLAAAAFTATALGESMSVLRQMKLDAWAAQRESGAFDVDRYQLQAATACVNGKAGEYGCNNVDLVSFLRHQDIGSTAREGNDVWGRL